MESSLESHGSELVHGLTRVELKHPELGQTQLKCINRDENKTPAYICIVIIIIDVRLHCGMKARGVEKLREELDNWSVTQWLSAVFYFIFLFIYCS